MISRNKKSALAFFICGVASVVSGSAQGQEAKSRARIMIDQMMQKNLQGTFSLYRAYLSREGSPPASINEELKRAWAEFHESTRDEQEDHKQDHKRGGRRTSKISAPSDLPDFSPEIPGLPSPTEDGFESNNLDLGEDDPVLAAKFKKWLTHDKTGKKNGFGKFVGAVEAAPDSVKAKVRRWLEVPAEKDSEVPEPQSNDEE